MSNTTTDISHLRKLVRSHIEKQAGDASSATDPTEKGKVVAKEHPDNTAEKKDMPGNEANQSNEGQKLEDKELKPSSACNNTPPAPKDGNAEDNKVTKKAGSIRDRINALRNLNKKAEDETAEATEDAPADTTEKSASEDTDATNTDKEGATKEANTEPRVELDSEALFKLANAIFETEEGVTTVLPILRKKAGADAALELLQDASDQYNALLSEAYEGEVNKQAAAEAENFVMTSVAGLLKEAAAANPQDSLNKIAAAHTENMAELNPLEKQAYMQGAGPDAAAMGAAPEAGGGELEGAGEEGATIEQIVQLLQLAVESGEIAPEQAEALLAELMGEGGGEELPGEEIPAEEVPLPEEEAAIKEASAAPQGLAAESGALLASLTKKD